MRLRLRREAEADLAAARDWYDDQRIGLGEEFVEDIEKMLELICSQARLFPFKHRGVRRALIHRFPYAIFYLEDSETVLGSRCGAPIPRSRSLEVSSSMIR